MNGNWPLRLGVLADDLTGAHATACQLHEQGRDAVVIWDEGSLQTAAADVVVDMRTRDRSAPPAELAKRWADLLISAGCTRLELRVDTTLRGSTASELSGVLSAKGLAQALVVAVPAYPSAGRRTVGGMQVVFDSGNWRKIEDTGRRLFGDELWEGVPSRWEGTTEGSLADEIVRCWRSGIRRILVDAHTTDHLAVAARAVELARAHVPEILTMSSGAWLKHYLAPRTAGVVLALIASPTTANTQQLDTLREAAGQSIVVLDCAIDQGIHPKAMESALEALPQAIVVDTTNIDPRAVEVTDPFRHPAAIGARAIRLLGEALRRRSIPCLGFVVSGGDAAAHLVDELGAQALAPLYEVAPLCPLGQVVGGPWEALPFITKGGVIGTPETLAHLIHVVSISKLQEVGATPTKESHV